MEQIAHFQRCLEKRSVRWSRTWRENSLCSKGISYTLKQNVRIRAGNKKGREEQMSLQNKQVSIQGVYVPEPAPPRAEPSGQTLGTGQGSSWLVVGAASAAQCHSGPAASCRGAGFGPRKRCALSPLRVNPVAFNHPSLLFTRVFVVIFFLICFICGIRSINSLDCFQKRKPERSLLSGVSLNIAVIPTVSSAVSFWKGVKSENTERCVCSLPSLLGCLLLSVSTCKKCKVIFSSFTEGYFIRLSHSVGTNRGAKSHVQDYILITSSSVEMPIVLLRHSLLFSLYFLFLDRRPPESTSLLSEPAAERSKNLLYSPS